MDNETVNPPSPLANPYFISRIKFKGFKSFKNAQAEFPKGFVALAGPNGSGKSNVADAIRFCLGEMATKAIRVKRASDLINLNSNKGEVTLVLQNASDPKQTFEIHRSINSEGKTSYQLNGKSMTRTNVIESLRPHGLEVGPHNIIAQGQVQRIVEMNAKERRQIIDQVAGIAEFDDKKREALGELSTVESKISEAKIILSERNAYLSELEREKDAAIAYQQAKESLERARATLIHLEYTKLSAQFDELLANKTQLGQKIVGLESQLADLSKQKATLDNQRKELAAKMEKGGKKESIVTQIQDAKVRIAQGQTNLEHEQKAQRELEVRIAELSVKKAELAAKHLSLDAQIKQKEIYLKTLENKVAEAKSKAGSSGDEQLLAQIDALGEDLTAVKEKLAAASGKKEGILNLLEHKQSLVAEVKAEIQKLGGQGENPELERFSQSIEKINTQLSGIFEQEKELNRKIPKLDQELLSAREKVAALKGSASISTTNPALIIVKSLKEKGTAGIYGPMSELIEVDSRFSQAAEAAAGGRLNYVVVDTLDTANQVIAALKSAKGGRCSFIPLDRISFNKYDGSAPRGSLGRMSDFIKYDPRIDSAVRYIFEDTVLVNDVESAKAIGIGKYRMVSLGGELMERSGVITGGSYKSSLLSRSSFAKAEAEVDSIKAEREGAYAQLYSLRDEMQTLRKERASLELKLKSAEAEFGSSSQRAARLKTLREQMARHQDDIAVQKSSLSQIEQTLGELAAQQKVGQSRIEAAREQARAAKEQEKKKAGDAQSRYERALEEQSQFTTELDTRRQEHRILGEQLDSLKSELSAAQADSQARAATAAQLDKELVKSSKTLQTLEAQLKEVSATVQKHYEQMQRLQGQLDALGEQEGKIKYENDAHTRQLNELNIRNATLQTKLADLKAEHEKYAQIPLLEEMPKPQLESLVSESDAKIAQLGMVNLKAPQIYEEKKVEIEQMNQKVQTLDSERTAVLGLISEIETKKVRLFSETFDAVNSHFKRLFSMVYRGEASLSLDDPANPLESGMSMRVRGEHDKKDKYLESMSGGEKSLLALMFIFALQMKKPAPFYILDEAEAALDKANASKMAEFIRQMSKTAQFIAITHNDAVLSSADVVLGVSKGSDGSKIVGVNLAHGIQFVKADAQPASTA